MRSAIACVLAGLLAGCGGPRVEAVDAVSGAPVAGGLLAEADGYETRVVQPGEAIALRPLWEARFLTPSERPPPRPERSSRPCCPGVQAR